MDAPTHREGKAPMTPDEEAASAKAAKIAKARAEATRNDRLMLQAPNPTGNDLPLLGISAEDAAESIALQKQFDEANKSQSLVEQLAREESDTADLIKKKRIKWFNDTILRRHIATPITGARIKGPQKLTEDSDQIFLIISRANGVVRTEKLSWMHAFGLSEWMETIKFINKSRSMYREYVLNHFDRLMKKIAMIKRHYKLTSPPQLSSLKASSTNVASVRSISASASRSSKNPESLLQKLSKEGKAPDVSLLNLTLPTDDIHPEGTILSTPEHGIYFWDADSCLRFFRASEIPIADSQLLHVILGVIKIGESGRIFYSLVSDELKKRDAVTAADTVDVMVVDDDLAD